MGAVQPGEEGVKLMKKIELQENLHKEKSSIGLVLLIACGFALPVAAGIAIYKLVKKIKAHSVETVSETTEITETTETEDAE